VAPRDDLKRCDPPAKTEARVVLRIDAAKRSRSTAMLYDRCRYWCRFNRLFGRSQSNVVEGPAMRRCLGDKEKRCIDGAPLLRLERFRN